MESGNERKCFHFIWKIKNASYFWQKDNIPIRSPSFVVEAIERTKFQLILWPFHNDNVRKMSKIGFSLFRRRCARVDTEMALINWQISLLASDGRVLSSCDRRKGEFSGCFKPDILPTGRSDVFVERKSEFLPQDTLTVSCKIWKNDFEFFGESSQWIAHTRLGVEKRSFLWEIGNFSSLKSEKKFTYGIESSDDGRILISFGLLLNGESNSEEIRFAVSPIEDKIRFFTFQVTFVDALGNAVQHLRDEIRFDVPGKRKVSSVSLSKAKLMEKSDVLSLRCVCDFPAGMILEETERVIPNNNTFENSDLERHSLFEENLSPNLQRFLNNDLKSMLSERIQSDVMLKTSSKTYPAHKCILSARSPVFKAMFSNDMKEKIKNSVDITDLSDETASRMLQYVYSAEVQKLEWCSAMELYEASDKYEILTLKDVCSSFLKKHLCQNNACEALVLADLHHDEDLKSFVQKFILKHGDSIIYSEEWENLMKANLKLAADTMRLKFKSK